MTQGEIPFSRREFLSATLAAGALRPLGMSAFAASSATDSGSQPKRIGFVDDNLDNFHARVYLKILREELRERGFVVTGATARQKEVSRQWAQNNELPFYDDIADLNEVVDYYAVLAPSTPETHEELCRQVFPFGKPTFVDKTFAPDAAAAKRLFALADQHGVAMQTTSALRYTAVQQYVAKTGPENLRHMVAWGSGSNFDEYAIHPLEMVISCLGHEIESVMRRGGKPGAQLLLNFSKGRTAVVNVYTNTRTPFAASLTTTTETTYLAVDTKRLFVDATVAMLEFFEAGRAQINSRETMAIMRILDAARQPEAMERFVKL